MTNITSAFVCNRTEEMGDDLYRDFIFPPFFDEIQIENARKTVAIVGGRGCGKTMLLRYLSYHSQFSEHNQGLPEELPFIGLYLRPDTNYLNSFAGDGGDKEWWIRAFEHALGLLIAEEMIASLEALNSSPERVQRYGGLDELDFSDLTAFDPMFPSNFTDTLKYIRRKRIEFRTWLNNCSEQKRPTLFPMRELLEEIVRVFRDSLKYLSNCTFGVFLDEYENMRLEQQKFINTLIKFYSPPVVFHIAMKRNAMITRETLGNEQIQIPADYRAIDIESLMEDHFTVFAAELFFFRLAKQGIQLEGLPIDSYNLTTRDGILDRSTEAYKEKVVSRIKEIFPGKSYREIAQLVLKDSTLKNRLRNLLEEGLKLKNASHIDVSKFLRKEAAAESVVSGALLNQKTQNVEHVLRQLDIAANGEISDFHSTKKDWTNNYLVGTLFWLYHPLPRPCPLYAGFSTYCSLSRGNIRHFLELCYLAVKKVDFYADDTPFVVSVDTQASAAREASQIFLDEINRSGTKGNKMSEFARALGRVFQLSQRRNSQSEPEITHFSVHNTLENEPELRELLAEAEKWSVFYTVKETKVKSVRYEGKDFVLNPIYAPFFRISYRKGRKLDLSVEELVILSGRDDQQRTRFLKEFERRWGVTDNTEAPQIEMF